MHLFTCYLVVLLQVGSHSKYQNTRCFILIRSDGTTEDFSYHKCVLGALEIIAPDRVKAYQSKWMQEKFEWSISIMCTYSEVQVCTVTKWKWRFWSKLSSSGCWAFECSRVVFDLASCLYIRAMPKRFRCLFCWPVALLLLMNFHFDFDDGGSSVFDSVYPFYDFVKR